MKIEANRKVATVGISHLHKGEVYERVGGTELKCIYLVSNQDYLVQLASGEMHHKSIFMSDLFIHHPNATLVL